MVAVRSGRVDDPVCDLPVGSLLNLRVYIGDSLMEAVVVLEEIQGPGAARVCVKSIERMPCHDIARPGTILQVPLHTLHIRP